MTSQNVSHRSRLHELEDQFTSLATRIPDSPEKQAISILHGLLQETWRNMNNSPYGQAMGPTIQDVANLYRQAPKMEGEAQNHPLPVGIPAPEFALPDATGKLRTLRDFRGQRVLLVFYPLDWSPGCSQQLDLYESELQEFTKRGVQPVAISVDSIYSHGAWATVRKISFPLLADFNPKGEVARKYNVYREDDGFSERALYLIDAKGIIQYAYVSPFLHHIPDIYELFNNLDATKVAHADSLTS